MVFFDEILCHFNLFFIQTIIVNFLMLKNCVRKMHILSFWPVFGPLSVLLHSQLSKAIRSESRILPEASHIFYPIWRVIFSVKNLTCNLVDASITAIDHIPHGRAMYIKHCWLTCAQKPFVSSLLAHIFRFCQSFLLESF